MAAVPLAQFEENLMFRLAQLEQRLDAYRQLHADELDEIARGLAELKHQLEQLPEVSAPSHLHSPGEPAVAARSTDSQARPSSADATSSPSQRKGERQA
jgi:hypothetical protein